MAAAQPAPALPMVEPESTLPRSETSVRARAGPTGAEALQGSVRLGREAAEALEQYKQRDLSKGPSLPAPYAELNVRPVVVRFKATGNAPIMKQNFYKAH